MTRSHMLGTSSDHAHTEEGMDKDAGTPSLAAHETKGEAHTHDNDHDSHDHGSVNDGHDHGTAGTSSILVGIAVTSLALLFVCVSAGRL